MEAGGEVFEPVEGVGGGGGEGEEVYAAEDSGGKGEEEEGGARLAGHFGAGLS